MEWELAYAKDPQTFKFYQSLGPDHPVWVNQPEVSDDAMLFYDAFSFLSLSRPIAFGGALPITLAEIEVYGRLAAIAENDRMAFARTLRRIDMEYLALVERKKPKKPRSA